MVDMSRGKVYLVGAGPGHPGLLTLKGKRCLEQADAVVFDRLVSPRLLNFTPPHAELYYAGKESGNHAMSQEEINRLLSRLAAAGKTVVRLKGGDPFVLGRGGEEAQALHTAGIAWEVVPGVTSATAAPAYAGIPVTQRHIAPSFTVVTGHACTEHGGDSVDWGVLAQTPGTLLILMGVSQLPNIVERLTAAGKSAATPVALVRWGTRAPQQTLKGTLADIVDKVRETAFQSPAVIVIGPVVQLRDTLDWLVQLPLAGRRILVTADSRDEAEHMANQLEALGAETWDFSLDRHAAPDFGRLDDMVKAIDGGRIAALYFTSPATVALLFEQWAASGRDVRSLSRIQFGADDIHVEHALRQVGIRADLVRPEQEPLSAALTAGTVAAWAHAACRDGGRLAMAVTHADLMDVEAIVETYALYQPLVNANRTKALLDCVMDFAADAIWTSSSRALTAFLRTVSAAADDLAAARFAAAPVFTQTRAARDQIAVRGVRAGLAETPRHLIHCLASSCESNVALSLVAAP